MAGFVTSKWRRFTALFVIGVLSALGNEIHCQVVFNSVQERVLVLGGLKNCIIELVASDPLIESPVSMEWGACWSTGSNRTSA